MQPVVRLSRVSRHFGDVPAAQDVTFDVQEGETFGLLGHNGAGKTTLIRLLNGLLQPDSGTISTLGHDPAIDGHRVRSQTGVLTTYPGLDDYLSPSENLALYAAIHGLPTAEARSRSHALLRRLDIDPLTIQPCRSLSAGLKQRVALARALIHRPRLLLLDEPTANLDPIAAREVRDLVAELVREGRTVILSTHNLAEAEDLCDRVAILQTGNLLAVGSLSDLAVVAPHITLRVGAGQADLALKALRPHLNGQHVRVAGDVLEVAAMLAGEAPGLIRALVSSGVDVHEASPRSASLEDTYLALHQSRPRR